MWKKKVFFVLFFWCQNDVEERRYFRVFLFYFDILIKNQLLSYGIVIAPALPIGKVGCCLGPHFIVEPHFIVGFFLK